MNRAEYERKRALQNKRVIAQVRFQIRHTATRAQANENIDRLMRSNRSVCG